MTFDLLSEFLEVNPHFEWVIDDEDESIHFRNTNLSWYSKPERATTIKLWKLEEMDVEDLIREVNRGLEVEGITRITGYFTKLNSWNPGKLGELKDRNRMTVN